MLAPISPHADGCKMLRSNLIFLICEKITSKCINGLQRKSNASVTIRTMAMITTTIVIFMFFHHIERARFRLVLRKVTDYEHQADTVYHLAKAVIPTLQTLLLQQYKHSHTRCSTCNLLTGSKCLMYLFVPRLLKV